ncbi:hypothetical protein CRYUN_Cryun39dG0069000 [Craigia yunnanensis]
MDEFQIECPCINATTSPPKLPLIGNLHLFIGTQPHRCLARLAQKYGPVMLLQLGEVSTVVISSADNNEAEWK